ncbi:GNAT family N-acetyltransferase [Aeromicrobium sp. Leaf350]|uniref:GNAT family N-acetyltransferase n=1 Tax=Aeromicrobium sp. Leaf350 TaxID=2876565 RepID=UPI001E60CC79|nr:GNAT family N-acetyltransferase [Aeromicrobium sp. Leaf350]
MPVLQGTVVGLRPFRTSDVDAVLEASSDPYIPLVTSVPSQPDPALAAAFVQRQRDRARAGEGWSWAIEVADGRCVGQIGLWPRERAQGRASLGYWVRPSARRQGCASDALATAVAWAWTLRDLHRLELHVEPANLGSARAAERVGFEREGLLRSWLPVGDERRDVVVMALLRS